jgi:PAS domain S-box-containing protein
MELLQKIERLERHVAELEAERSLPGQGQELAGEERYRTIVQTSLDGFWINDLEGRILDVNDAYCRIIGYGRDELMRMRIPDVEAVEEPEETARHIEKILRQGYDRFETRHRRKDGAIVNIEVSATYSGAGGGQLVVVIRDITERKRAEEALRKLNAELEQRVRERTAELAASEERLVKETSAVADIVAEMLDGTLDDAETERQVLDACLDATSSVYGMIGVVNQHGKWDTTTYNSRTLGDCAFPEAMAWEMSTGMEIRGIWGWPIVHGEPLLCNNLQEHPDRVGQPKGTARHGDPALAPRGSA